MSAVTDSAKKEPIKSVLNPSQIEIAESAMDFIEGRLEQYYTRSKGNKATLKAFFLMLQITITQSALVTENIIKRLYKEPSEKMVQFFVKVNQLINANDPDYKICQQITSPQLMTVTKETKSKVLEAFGSYVKNKINEWVHKKGRDKVISKGSLNTLVDKYSNEVEDQQMHHKEP